MEFVLFYECCITGKVSECPSTIHILQLAGTGNALQRIDGFLAEVMD